MVFIGTFVDMIRHLDVEFDMVVDCIANGTIPDLDGIAKVRHHLEVCTGHQNAYQSMNLNYVVEYFPGPRTCGGAASSRSSVFSARVVCSRLAEPAFSYCYCQRFLRIVCPIGGSIVHASSLHLVTVPA